MTLSEARYIAATLLHLSEVVDKLPANDTRNLALIVSVKQAMALSESLLRERTE